VPQAGTGEVGYEPVQTSEYLAHEDAEKARGGALWQRIVNHEAAHPLSLKVQPTVHRCCHEVCAHSWSRAHWSLSL